MTTKANGELATQMDLFHFLYLVLTILPGGYTYTRSGTPWYQAMDWLVRTHPAQDKGLLVGPKIMMSGTVNTFLSNLGWDHAVVVLTRDTGYFFINEVGRSELLARTPERYDADLLNELRPLAQAVVDRWLDSLTLDIPVPVILTTPTAR